MLSKMPGDDWQKFAHLRSLYAYMYAHPGKKLLFMGCEFGQRREWTHDESLDWHLLENAPHAGLQRCVRDLHALYRQESAMHELDSEWQGFEWIDCNDSQSNVVTFIRRGSQPEDTMLFACNFSPVVRENYSLGAPSGGEWMEVLNTDAEIYGGGNVGNVGRVVASRQETHGRPYKIEVVLPPLAVVAFKR